MLEAAAFVSKFMLYGAALGGVGTGLHFALGIHANKRLFLPLGGFLAGATLLRFLVVHAQMGGGIAAAFSSDNLHWTWAGIGNQTIALLAGATLLAATRIQSRRVLAAAASFVIAVSFGLAGHSAGLEAPGVAPYVAMGHVLIAAFWFTSPATLWPRASHSNDEVIRRTRTFSRVAVFIVPAIFISGLWLLWRIGGGIDGVLSSLYGRLLLGKLALAMAILGLGALNMTVVTKELETAPASGRKALRATLRIDTVLFCGVLLLIASATTITGPTE